MVRQARSEATRRKIIDSAVDLINEIGYPAAGLGDIIERAELTKGALYYHFDSKEALATAIIEEGSETLLEAFRAAGRASSPAMENILHGSFVVTDVLASDRVARAGARLLRTFGAFNPAAKRTVEILVNELVERIKTATAEGDLRPTLDAETAGASILAGMLGSELLSSTLAEGSDLRARFARTWELLLPAIIADESLNYYREFLARQATRPTSPG
ncbi:TetR family transcriptional regulator [Mycolicibacterium madagascariense]|uniref:TetR family transcriptional regulator n=1 Tax=Mycolicibacterium madagascariense TaxID=212765 RepID=A0A7I7XEP9_9MYCO|nr:TetR/AcrR family transcriptional regulator [Mycolicibacterium madagascariense]MCV7015360.1 TetR/AcrR family transcriptional regulator [Mycolicibacterium madagascariense]BBZ27656.1 TetR family transcriptional regulator [Mycolicibacterium madagascariense]